MPRPRPIDYNGLMTTKCHACIKITKRGPVFCDKPATHTYTIVDKSFPNEPFTITVCDEHKMEYADEES